MQISKEITPPQARYASGRGAFFQDWTKQYEARSPFGVDEHRRLAEQLERRETLDNPREVGAHGPPEMEALRSWMTKVARIGGDGSFCRLAWEPKYFT